MRRTTTTTTNSIAANSSASPKKKSITGKTKVSTTTTLDSNLNSPIRDLAPPRSTASKTRSRSPSPRTNVKPKTPLTTPSKTVVPTTSNTGSSSPSAEIIQSAKSTPSIKEAIAKARLRRANKKTSDVQNGEVEADTESLKDNIKQARTSGRINLSNRSLTEIPEEVWKMYEVDSTAIDIDFSANNSDLWYQAVDLTRFIAADNQLKTVDKRIVEFNALVLIDLHNNQLATLPDEFGELQDLTTLNLSTNQFTELPKCLTSLSSLIDLQLSGNKLSGTLDLSFGNLARLEFLDISSNKLTELPEEIHNLKNLRKLNIKKNKLKEIPGLALSGMTKLEELEASENMLENIFSGLNDQPVNLPFLKRLDLRQNCLQVLDQTRRNATYFKPTISLPKLKELLISFNHLESLGSLLHTTPELEILAIGDNKFHEIPEGLTSLKKLKRLDLRNNRLRLLSAELGLLESLDVLLWDGNPLRNSPKGQSTTTLLKSLRDRLTTVDLENMEGSMMKEPGSSPHNLGRISGRRAHSKDDDFSDPLNTLMVGSKTLDLSKKSLSSISDDEMESLPFEPNIVHLGFNSFQTIPTSFKLFKDIITTLQLDHNKIITFPSFDDKSLIFVNLHTLDLSANQITSLPVESEQTAFPNLKILNLNQNRISALPAKLPFPHLTTLLASMNALTAITISTFENMEFVDLSNNNIGHLPPELGNLLTIKTLLVEGNSFRVPRYTIVQQGTSAGSSCSLKTPLSYINEQTQASATSTKKGINSVAIVSEITTKTVSLSSKRRQSVGEVEEEISKKEAKTGTVSRTFSIFSSKPNIQWREHETLLIGVHLTSDCGKLEGRAKISSFDLDCTLIKVKGNSRYPKDENDWVWWNKKVPQVLKQLCDDDFKIVIFSNQGGLTAGKSTAERKRKEFKNKIKHIGDKLDIPFQIFVGTAVDNYRKPMTGGWDYFIKNENAGVVIDKEKSFYCGDAASRAAGWKDGASRDWSDTDRKLAENIGIKFFTPEELFDNEKSAPYSFEFNPKNYPRAENIFASLLHNHKRCEMVVFVGYPASGKSTVARFLVSNGYISINMDNLKSKAKCIKFCEQALMEKRAVVIDNTNPDIESRKNYIDLAKKHRIPVRCFWFTASEALSKHNNMFRAFGDPQSDKPKVVIPEIAYNIYNSRFMEPQLKEGFEEIKRIDFLFEGDDQKRALWEKWYI
ncbi:hypothetical protein G9A89_009745 [Geosiphon pyriformis]|nr:hypothetical protein G9A89_009745 [Geosiphon pyriformis]